MFWVGLVVGLFVGWNLLKQPVWIEKKIEKIKDKIAEKLG